MEKSYDLSMEDLRIENWEFKYLDFKIQQFNNIIIYGNLMFTNFKVWK